MDLLSFLEGLCFLVAAAMAFELRGGLRRAPWGHIAAFALLYGVSSWTGLVAEVLEITNGFAVADDLLRAISALTLLEAVRTALPPGLWRRAGLAGHAAILVAIASEMVLRGDVSRLLSVWMIPPASFLAAGLLVRVMRGCGRMQAAGIGLLAGGLLMHAVGEVLELTAGGPNGIDFGGAMLVAAGLAIAAHAHDGWPEDYRRQRRRRAVRSAVVLLASLAVGVVAIEGSGARAREALRRQGDTTAAMLASQTEVILAAADLSAALVAHWPECAVAVVGGGADARAALARRLDAFKQQQELSQIYLLDRAGTVVDATDIGTAPSPVGRNLASRPYAAEALAGMQARYWGRGLVTGQRGFYAAAPIRDGSGMIVGAAVVKQDAERLHSVLRVHPLSLLVSREGVVFASDEPEWLDRTVGAAGPVDARQYGAGPFQPLLGGRAEPGAVCVLGGTERMISLSPPARDGWRILVLAATAPVAVQRLVVMAMLGLVLGLVLIGYVALATLGDRNWELEASRQRLRTALAEAEAARAAAEDAARAKSTFLATMSHEIRTPLNGVIGMADVLLREELPPTAREAAATIRGSGGTLLELVNQILDFSKIEAGKLELERRGYEIRALAEEVVALFRPAAAAKGIALALGVAPGVPLLTTGDPMRVRQVLSNLVSNAVKFTRSGEVRLALAALPAGEGAPLGWLEATVSDTGIGIPAEALPRLFQMFTQVEAGTARRFGGSGLGLAITQRLVVSMGGSIAVDSRPGQGSCFRVRLPLAPATRASTGTTDSLAALPPPGMRVLLAEDDPVNRMVAAGLFRHLHVIGEVVEDGAQAVAAWERGGHDIILMDVQMPGMDGLAATRAIREREAERGLARVPVIALTANAFTEDRIACQVAGMDELVAKPVTLETLSQALARYARRSAS